MSDGAADLSDAALTDAWHRAAFDYFTENVNPENGLVTDTSRPGSPASIAVVGFALSAWPIGVERGWIDRHRAVALTLAALRFFRDSPQGREPDVTGYRGFYYHFLDMQTGRRTWDCELSMVDTGMLMAGIRVARRYFDRAEEAEIRDLADALYARVDWAWAQGGKVTLRLGWKPKSGFLSYGWDGYNEAMVLYVLGAGAPEHPVSDDCYVGWTATYQWENIYDIDMLYGGPLFMHQFSHAWVDFRGIRDPFMKQKRSDYFENSRNATELHREYARRNPQEFRGYGDDLWGISACDGPGGFRMSLEGTRHSFYGYAARGVPFGPDDGTIAPWSWLAALPFTPDAALGAVRHLAARYPSVAPTRRMPSAFNPTLAGRRGFGPDGWISDGFYGLDQGIATLMIENHRSGMIWELTRSDPVVRAGLARLGFEGGWLRGRVPHGE